MEIEILEQVKEKDRNKFHDKQSWTYEGNWGV
jgi:hypothetical protein